MRNRMYGGVRGRKTKVGGKLLRFPPTRFEGILGFHRRDVLIVLATHGERSHHYLKKTINDFGDLPVFCNFVGQADARFSFYSQTEVV